jgi:hypothetical protein
VCGIFGKKRGNNTVDQLIHAAAETRAQQQIQSLSLKPTTIPPNGTESGYVFFPLGEYQKIQAVLGDPEAGSATTVSGNITR